MNILPNLPRPLLTAGMVALVMSTTLACEDSEANVSPEVGDTSCDRLCDRDFWSNVLVAAEVRAELDRGTDIHATGGMGFGGGTPLHWASAHSNNPTAIEVLLDRGANVHAQDNLKDTPLHWAAKDSVEPAIVALLLAYVADINARGHKNRTPLHDAVARRPGRATGSVIAFLVDRGTDIHARDESGYTPCDLVGIPYPPVLLCG
jgi:hypothetical protein